MNPHEQYTTLPGMLTHVMDTYQNSRALNYRHLGHWEHIAAEEFVEEVRRLALGLKVLGLSRNDRFGIIVPPSPQWLMVDLAVMANAAVSVPLFPNVAPENFRIEAADCGMKYLFIKNCEDLDKSVRARLHEFRKVIALDVGCTGANVINYTDLLTLGDDRSASDPGLFARMRDSVREDDLATIIYTSGSTGSPKGVLLTHRNLVSQIHAANQRFPLDPGHDLALNCLPLAHVFGRMCMYFYLSAGASIYFADDLRKLDELLRQIRPTVLGVVPRLLEKVRARMRAGAQEVTGPRRLIAEAAFSHAERADPDHHAPLTPIYDGLVYRKLRDALGGRVRLLLCGSAKLAEETERFFRNIGVPLYQGYGLTECSPVVTANYPGHNRRGTVGRAFPGVEIRISADSEIQVKGPGVFRGYHHNQGATDEMVDRDGWLHTGDLGHLDNDGYLTIAGRRKELLKTSGGKYVSPQPIEQAACRNDLIDMAAVIAEGREFVSLLPFPNRTGLGKIKAEDGCEAMSDEEYLRSRQVTEELVGMIEGINAKLNHWEQVRKFKLVTRPLSVGAGELTPTMKMRRDVIERNLQKEIDEMYRE